MAGSLGSEYVPGTAIPPGTVHIGMGQFTKVRRQKWGVVFEDGSRRCTGCLTRKTPTEFYKGRARCKICDARSAARRLQNG
jgi:hypothetical protein